MSHDQKHKLSDADNHSDCTLAELNARISDEDVASATAVSNNATAISDNSTAISNNATAISDNASAVDGKLDSVQEGTNISIDNTDPKNPIISSTGSATALEYDIIINNNNWADLINAIESGSYVNIGVEGNYVCTDDEQKPFVPHSNVRNIIGIKRPTIDFNNLANITTCIDLGEDIRMQNFEITGFSHDICFSCPTETQGQARASILRDIKVTAAMPDDGSAEESHVCFFGVTCFECQAVNTTTQHGCGFRATQQALNCDADRFYSGFDDVNHAANCWANNCTYGYNNCVATLCKSVGCVTGFYATRISECLSENSTSVFYERCTGAEYDFRTEGTVGAGSFVNNTSYNKIWRSYNDSNIGVQWVEDLLVSSGLKSYHLPDKSGTLAMLDDIARFAIKKITDDYVATLDDVVILMDASSNDVDLQLPDPTTCPRKMYFIKDIDDTNDVTISAHIDSTNVYTFASVNKRIRVISDGVQWWKI